MSARTILARLETDEEGVTRVLAPGVGWWSHLPPPGVLLGPGSAIGSLSQLNRHSRLLLPDKAVGGIAVGIPRKRALAVEFGQLLFTMTPVGAASQQRAAAGDMGGGDEVAAGSGSIVSPTDGVFYRKSSPDAAPFIEVGSRIRPGDPIGLVEVMKTFNQILYEGPGCSEEAEVVEIRCEDAEEVSAGQILVVLR
jgi:acetyl-CoA carboxylase biotin carboxyl carrier protein